MSDEHTIEYVTAAGDERRLRFQPDPHSLGPAVLVDEEMREGEWKPVGMQGLQKLRIDGDPLSMAPGCRGP